jgi:hypothetical protein
VVVIRTRAWWMAMRRWMASQLASLNFFWPASSSQAPLTVEASRLSGSLAWPK